MVVATWHSVLVQRLFLGSFISYSAARRSSMVDGFYLSKSVLFLVNVPNFSRNLLRVAISYFVPRISGMYIELETL